jgi:hypothetical protein
MVISVFAILTNNWVESVNYIFEGVSKISRTDAVKIIKLAKRLIGRHHHQNSSLSHVDTVHNVSSIFETFPGSYFLSECQALSAIRPGSPQWYQPGVLSALISFLEIGSHRVPNQGSTVGATSSRVSTQSTQNVAVEPGIHSLACWDRCLALPQLLYRWRNQSGIFWIQPRKPRRTLRRKRTQGRAEQVRETQLVKNCVTLE